jgi:hypothetical protein
MAAVRALPHQNRSISDCRWDEMVPIEFEVLVLSHLFTTLGVVPFGTQAVEFDVNTCR